MAVAYVRTSGKQTCAGASSDTYTWSPTNPAVGNHVIAAAAMWDASVACTGINWSDNQSPNSYAEQIVDYEYTTNHDWINIASAKIATSSGTFTVTLAPQSATAPYIHWGLIEFSGIATSNWADRTGTYGAAPASATSTPVTATAENTTAAGVAIAIANLDLSDSDLNITGPSGYTNVYVEDDGNVPGGTLAYKIYSETETSSATWGHDAVATNYGRAAGIATYKAAAAAGRATKNTRSHPLGLASGRGFMIGGRA